MDLVVRAKADQEQHVLVAPEQHAQVIVDAERPVLAEIAFELVRAQQGVVWVRGRPVRAFTSLATAPGSPRQLRGWTDIHDHVVFEREHFARSSRDGWIARLGVAG
jgi:hypothetical protein